MNSSLTHYKSEDHLHKPVVPLKKLVRLPKRAKDASSLLVMEEVHEDTESSNEDDKKSIDLPVADSILSQLK